MDKYWIIQVISNFQKESTKIRQFGDKMYLEVTKVAISWGDSLCLKVYYFIFWVDERQNLKECNLELTKQSLSKIAFRIKNLPESLIFVRI
jgi:hypothetical protein